MISAERASFPVSAMCDVLKVSRSGFHGWQRRAPSQRALSDAWLTSRITEIHEQARGVYGSRRVQAELRLGQGIRVSRRRVRRLMAQAGISGLVKVKRGRTTIQVPGVRVADDLLERKFRPDAPNVLWVADITYLRTWEGWLYLAAVQDAYSRRIVGWAMTEHMRTELVADALQMAVQRRRPEPGLIHHSDQGSPNMSLSASASRPATQGSPCRWDPAATATRTQSLRASSRRSKRARAPPAMAEQTRPQLRRLRVHRGVLQPPQTTPHPRTPLPRGIREHHNHNDQGNPATKAHNCPQKHVHSIDLLRPLWTPDGLSPYPWQGGIYEYLGCLSHQGRRTHACAGGYVQTTADRRLRQREP